jgi:hypothetical protein
MTETHTEAEKWRYRANIRQGIISKLEKRVRRLEAEVAGLRVDLNAANARLALYDGRERA